MTFQEPPMQQTQEPRLLKTLGHTVFNLARYAANKVSQLPKPLGPVIGLAEGMMKPLAQLAENQALHALEFMDNKIYVVGEVVENYVGYASDVISVPKQMVSEVRRRGVVGSVADIWVEYEDPVKKQSGNIVRFMDKVPGLGLVSPVITGVGAFTFNRVSEWLVEHSEAKEKLPHDEDAPKHTEESGQEPDLTDTEDHEFVEAKLEPEETAAVEHIERKQGSKKKDAEEADELTKLMDAGWSLGKL